MTTHSKNISFWQYINHLARKTMFELVFTPIFQPTLRKSPCGDGLTHQVLK
jgi:hypothetical protein